MTLHRLLEKCKAENCPEVDRLHEAMNLAMKEYAEWKLKEIAVDSAIQELKKFVKDIDCFPPWTIEDQQKTLIDIINKMEKKGS